MDISSNIDEVTHLRRLVETDDPSFFGFKKLRVRGRDLHELPVAIFSLLELEVLSLSPDREASLYYRLYFLPKQIGQLINLRILILDTNALTNLPPEISNLSHLEILTLSNNYLTSLPPQFHRLNELQSLHLANNSFSVFPPQICILKNLQFLDLSDNKISELPHSISQLHSLQTLLLFRNRLHVLPDTLCDLTELRCLWLGENCLTNLPRCFGKLDKLDWSFIYTSAVLDGNPMERPPMDICRQALKWYKMAFSRSLSMSLILLYIAFCFLDPVADSRGACDFRGIANCWTDLIKQKCGTNDCTDDVICKNEDLLAECFQVNCENNASNVRCWSKLFTGQCADTSEKEE